MQGSFLRDVKNCEARELLYKYNIEVNADGSVYDHYNKQLFPNVMDWHGKSMVDNFRFYDTMAA